MESHCLVTSLCSCLYWLMQLFVFGSKLSQSWAQCLNLMLGLSHFELWHFDIICHLKFIGFDKFVAWTSVNSQPTRFSLSHPNNYKNLKELLKKILRTCRDMAFKGPQLPPSEFCRKFKGGFAKMSQIDSRVNGLSMFEPRGNMTWVPIARWGALGWIRICFISCLDVFEANPQELCVLVLFHLPTPSHR